jgi:hypothetical protein
VLPQAGALAHAAAKLKQKDPPGEEGHSGPHHQSKAAGENEKNEKKVLAITLRGRGNPYDGITRSDPA